MISIFFYGLFMDEKLLKDKGFNPSPSKLAYIENFELRIGERATLVPAESECAYGAVISLSKDEADALYSDPSVADYIPESLHAVTLQGELLDVICYNLPMEKLSGKNREYARSLTEAVQRVGLPVSYVEQIKRWSE